METELLRTKLGEARLLEKLLELRDQVIEEGELLFAEWRPALTRRAFVPSALNLAYYMALRRRDLRPLQEALMPLGLSSLGRCEARVLPNLDAVIASLAAIAGDVDRIGVVSHPRPAAFYRGNRLLDRHTRAVFGPTPINRQVRIMVTLPVEAAEDYLFVRRLVERGADVVRINAAHDSAAAWMAMAANTRKAAEETGRSCRIMIDLEGPRARTARIGGRGEEVRVRVGDRLRLVSGRPERGCDPPEVECSLPEAVAQLRPGQAVCIDEGKIRLVAEECEAEAAFLRVTTVEAKGRLRPNKGLNFPDTDLRLDPLTAKDLADLDTIVDVADIVGYSFVQSAADIARLQRELTFRVPGHSLAISAKIETASAIQRLPEIIVQGAGAQPLAVMIARGDLAVEIGFGRLAEMQEEILWLCEASHVPVVWATSVLDGFVRKGAHSRAEMTDAAMAERADCVMLNKGPYLLEAVTVLDDVLSRMEAHQIKKTSRLRALRAW